MVILFKQCVYVFTYRQNCDDNTFVKVADVAQIVSLDCCIVFQFYCIELLNGPNSKLLLLQLNCGFEDIDLIAERDFSVFWYV